jgi:hypothetical protein
MTRCHWNRAVRSHLHSQTLDPKLQTTDSVKFFVSMRMHSRERGIEGEWTCPVRLAYTDQVCPLLPLSGNSISVYTGKGRRKSEISITPLASQRTIAEAGNAMWGQEESQGVRTGVSEHDRQQRAPGNKGADVADEGNDEDDMRVTDRTTAGETAEIKPADGTGSKVRSMSLEDMAPLPSESLEVWKHSLSKTGKNPNPRALAPLPPMKTAPGAAGLVALPRELKQQTNQEKIQALRQEIQKLREKLIMKGEQVARDNAEMSECLALLETRVALGMEEEEQLSERLMGA